MIVCRSDTPSSEKSSPELALPQALPTAGLLPDAVMVTVDRCSHGGMETSQAGTIKEDQVTSVAKEDAADLVLSTDEDCQNKLLLQTTEEDDKVCVRSEEIGGHVEQRQKTHDTQPTERPVQRSSIRLNRLESEIESCPPIHIGRTAATITRSGSKVPFGPDVGLESELGAPCSGGKTAGKRNGANLKQKPLKDLLQGRPQRESTSVAKKKAKRA